MSAGEGADRLEVDTAAAVMPPSARRIAGEVFAIGLMVASCCSLLLGLLTRRQILLDQPLWTPADVRLVAWLVGGYALTCLVLSRLPALPARVAAALLLTVYVVTVAGPGPVGAALLVCIACLSAGDLLISRLTPDLGPVLKGLLSVLVGFALLACLVNVAAHFPVNRPAFYVALFTVVMVINVRGLRWYWRCVADWSTRPRPDAHRWTFAAASLLVLVLLLQSVRAMLPETGGDGMGMHLIVASQLASQHRWLFDPTMFTWALYPLGSEWIEGVGWILGGEIAARAMNFVFSVIIVLTIVAVSVRFLPAPRALLAGCLFASAGIAFGLTANVYTEPALAAFLLGAFVVATLPRVSWTTLTSITFGILCGGSLLTKVTALYVIIPLFVLMFVRLSRERPLRSVLLQSVVAFASMASTGFAPYAYSFWRSGNPVFPLYNEVFRSSLAPYASPSDPRWLGKFSWRMPFSMTFSTSAYCEVYNGTLGFQYLALMPLALVSAAFRRNKLALTAFVIALVAAATMLYSMQYVRYAFPMMALASIALAAAFQGGQGHVWSWLSRAACAVGILVVALNLAFYPGGAWNLPGFQGRALVSDLARQQFVDQQAPQRELIAAVNALDGRMARVAFFGPAFAAGLQGTPLLAMGYNPEFRDAVDGAETADELSRVFQDRAVTHVIVPVPQVDAGGPLADVLTREAQVVGERNGVRLYRLLP